MAPSVTVDATKAAGRRANLGDDSFDFVVKSPTQLGTDFGLIRSGFGVLLVGFGMEANRYHPSAA